MALRSSKLLSIFRNSSSPYDEGTGEFNPLDIEAAKHNLQLAERAAENGAKGIPKPSATSKDATASAIDAYLNKAILQARDKYIDLLKAMDDLSKTQSEPPVQELTKLYEDGKARLEVTFRGHSNALFSAGRELALGERELTNFRAKHGLERPARYPDDPTRAYGIIFFLACLEILTNAYALGGSHKDGPLGVVVEILMFGVANVGVSYLLGGYVWRGFYHRSGARRWAAGFLAAAMGSFLVFLNLLLAHYRDALARLAAEYTANNLELSELIGRMGRLGDEAISNVFSLGVLQMDDFKSYLLLFVGLLAATFTTKESFGMDDPYPGYGKLARAQDHLVDSFSNALPNALRGLNAQVEQCTEALNACLEYMKGFAIALGGRKGDRERLHEKYKNWLRATKATGEALYAFYREENLKAREGGEEPACFSTHHYELPEDAAVSLKEPELIPFDYGPIERKCEGYSEELNQLLESYRKRFKDIEGMSPDEF